MFYSVKRYDTIIDMRIFTMRSKIVR